MEHTWRIVIASDHAGYPLKQAVLEHLAALGIRAVDMGPDNAESPVDYPDYAQLATQAIVRGEYDQGILICGTGLGMSIAANKTPGIRAALCHDTFTAHLARAHNDANVLCMGAWVMTPQRAAQVVDEWLKAEFEQGRHVPRLAKLEPASAAHSNLHATSDSWRVRSAQIGVALSPYPTDFAPLLFAGQLEAGLAAVARAGFNAVELSLRGAESIDPTTLRAQLDRYGLSVSAIATGQNCLHEGLCLSALDPEIRQAAIARVKGLIGLAASLGAGVILGGIRGRLSQAPTLQAQARAAAIAAMRECAHLAHDKGVTILLEPINRYETNFINTATEALALAQELDVPSVKLLLDTFHMNVEEVDLATTIRVVGDRLAYVHLSDSNRCAPGMGHLNWPNIFEALAAIDYRGPLVAEILPIPDGERAALQTIYYLKPFVALPMRPIVGERQ